MILRDKLDTKIAGLSSPEVDVARKTIQRKYEESIKIKKFPESVSAAILLLKRLSKDTPSPYTIKKSLQSSRDYIRKDLDCSRLT